MLKPFLTLILIIITAPTLFAQTPAEKELAKAKRDSLRGISAVGVLVEYLPEEIDNQGLLRKAIQTDVELKLRKSRIKIAEDTSSGYLYIRLTSTRVSQQLNGYSCMLEVMYVQPVRVVRNNHRLFAPTWDASRLGAMDIKNIAPQTRATLGDLVDEFINDLLAANSE